MALSGMMGRVSGEPAWRSPSLMRSMATSSSWSERQRPLSRPQPTPAPSYSALRVPLVRRQRLFSPFTLASNASLRSTLSARTVNRLGNSRRGMMSQAASGMNTGGIAVPTETTDAEPLSWLEGIFSPIVSPVVPYLDMLPTFIGLTPGEPYAHAISLVLLAIVLRTTITLPVAIWQRKRIQRMADHVKPAFEVVQRDFPARIVYQCKREGRSSEYTSREVRRQLNVERRRLLRQYNCMPLATIVTPLLVNIPLFLLATFTIRSALLTQGLSIANEVVPWWSPPTDLMATFDGEARVLASRGVDLTTIEQMMKVNGPTLCQVDKTMLAPVGLGLLTFMNVELTQYQRKALLMATNDVPKNEKKDVEAKEVQNRTPSEFRSVVLSNTMRAAAIAFVVVAAQAPAGLVIYWVASSCYTLSQTAVFGYLDQKRADAQAAAKRVAEAKAVFSNSSSSASHYVMRPRVSRDVSKPRQAP